MKLSKFFFASGVINIWFPFELTTISISEYTGSKYLLIVIDFPDKPKKSQLKIYAE